MRRHDARQGHRRVVVQGSGRAISRGGMAGAPRRQDATRLDQAKDVTIIRPSSTARRGRADLKRPLTQLDIPFHDGFARIVAGSGKIVIGALIF